MDLTLVGQEFEDAVSPEMQMTLMKPGGLNLWTQKMWSNPACIPPHPTYAGLLQVRKIPGGLRETFDAPPAVH
jgi:hypothetical protein